MSHLVRLRRRLPIVLTANVAATVAVALATPHVAIAENEPSVKLPETSGVAANLAAASPHNPADAPSEKNALTGNQQPRVITGGGGTYSATSLSPSATWQVSGQTGDFSWSYGLPVTPVPGSRHWDCPIRPVQWTV